MNKIYVKNSIILSLGILISLSAGIFGAQFEPGGWYENLRKPWFTPPDYIFPVVWPILYVMMGIAAGLIWLGPNSKDRIKAIILFVIQLIFNAMWSLLFFGLHEIYWALAEILVLFGLLFYLVQVFYRLRRVAAILMIPYLLWTGFASLLTLSISVLN